MNAWNRKHQIVPQTQMQEGPMEESILSMSAEERENLFKRADEGHSTVSEVFLILRGRKLRNSLITYSEIDLIFKRLGVNLTEHRFCELLSAAKLIRSKKLVGYTKLNFSYIEEAEFENLFEYMQERVSTIAKAKLGIAPSNLMNFSIITFGVFSITLLIVSNLMIYFFGGGLFGSIFCAFIPIGTIYYITRIKKMQDVKSDRIKTQLSDSFENFTSFKSEMLS
jgi:hypothetical protein